MNPKIFLRIIFGLLVGGAVGLTSCAAPRLAVPVVPPVIRKRLQPSIPVVFVGLRKEVGFRRTKGHGAVWRETEEKGISVISQSFQGEAAVLALGFVPLLMLAPPVRTLWTHGTTVSDREADDAARHLRKRGENDDWAAWVKRSVQQAWAAQGTAFSTVREYDTADLQFTGDPLSQAALAAVPERTLLYLHIAGPVLTSESARPNPGLTPRITIYYRVLDTRSGTVLTSGTIEENSSLERTLPEWAAAADHRLETEIASVVRKAAVKLAAVLR